MAKIEETRTFPGKSPDQLYNSFESAFKKAGFTTWKKRPIGWLALAKRTESESDVQSNLSARPGKDTIVTLLITSEKQSEEQLQNWTSEIWKALEEGLQ